MECDFPVVYLDPDRLRRFARDYDPVIPSFLEVQSEIPAAVG